MPRIHRPILEALVLTSLIGQIYVALADTETFIYQDNLASGWADWSWNVINNFANTSPVKNGSSSLATTLIAASSGLKVHRDSALSTSSYTSVKFWVHGGTGSNKSLSFYVQSGGVTYTSIPFVATANTWTELSMSMSALGSPATIQDLVFLNSSGAAQPTIYFDDIRLVGGTTGLPAPSNLSATANSTNQITIAWTDNSTNETGFDVERSTDSTNWIQIAEVSANMTNYVDTGLPASTLFYYRVAATNASGTSDYSNEATATTLWPGGHVWETSPPTRDGWWTNGKFRVFNNEWGTSDAELAIGIGNTMWADSYQTWGIVPNYTNTANTIPKAYPSVYRGYHYSTESVPNSGIPIKVSDITKLKARWRMREPAVGRHWALWDIYFNTNSTVGGKGWCNLMVIQNWRDPDGWMPNQVFNGPKQPLGNLDAGGVSMRCEKGWDAWMPTGAVVISAVPVSPTNADFNPTPLPDATFDLKALFLNLAQTGAISTNWYLIDIEVGWEVVYGTVPLYTDYFEIDLNNETKLDAYPPALQIQRATNQAVELRWQSLANFRIQSRADLGQGSWADETITPDTEGNGLRTALFPMTGSNRFLRLINP